MTILEVKPSLLNHGKRCRDTGSATLLQWFLHWCKYMSLNIAISLFKAAEVEKPRTVQKVQFCGSAQLQANYWKNKRTHLRKQDDRAWKALQGLTVPRVHLEQNLLQQLCFSVVVKKSRCRPATQATASFREMETPCFGVWAVQVPGSTLKTRYPSAKM